MPFCDKISNHTFYLVDYLLLVKTHNQLQVATVILNQSYGQLVYAQIITIGA